MSSMQETPDGIRIGGPHKQSDVTENWDDDDDFDIDYDDEWDDSPFGADDEGW